MRRIDPRQSPHNACRLDFCPNFRSMGTFMLFMFLICGFLAWTGSRFCPPSCGQSQSFSCLDSEVWRARTHESCLHGDWSVLFFLIRPHTPLVTDWKLQQIRLIWYIITWLEFHASVWQYHNNFLHLLDTFFFSCSDHYGLFRFHMLHNFNFPWKTFSL